MFCFFVLFTRLVASLLADVASERVVPRVRAGMSARTLVVTNMSSRITSWNPKKTT
jgi:hypothetical protein